MFRYALYPRYGRAGGSWLRHYLYHEQIHLPLLHMVNTSRVSMYVLCTPVLQKARNAGIWNSSQFRYLQTVFLYLLINLIYLQENVL